MQSNEKIYMCVSFLKILRIFNFQTKVFGTGACMVVLSKSRPSMQHVSVMSPRQMHKPYHWIDYIFLLPVLIRTWLRLQGVTVWQSAGSATFSQSKQIGPRVSGYSFCKEEFTQKNLSIFFCSFNIILRSTP